MIMPRESRDYPAHIIKCRDLPKGGPVIVRPIRVADTELLQAFVRSLSPRTRRDRFFSTMCELPPYLLARFTQVDYRREMVLLAAVQESGKEAVAGVAQYAPGPREDRCEFALVVHDAWQRRRVGSFLLDSLMQCADAASYRSMEGDVLRDNTAMLEMAASRRFEIRTSPQNLALRRVQVTLEPGLVVQRARHGQRFSHSGKGRLS